MNPRPGPDAFDPKASLRKRLEVAVESMLALLDEMDGDADLEPSGDELDASYQEGHGHNTIAQGGDRHEDAEDDGTAEPWLGAPERHPHSREAEFFGVTAPRSGFLRHEQTFGQEKWVQGGHDDRENDGDDLEPDHDGEHSCGWPNEGNQGGVMFSSECEEPSLGWPEQVDQVSRCETAPGCGVYIEDAEPDLGWAESHGEGIVGSQHCLDDREYDDECQPNGDEGEVSAFIWGGGDDSPELKASR